MVKHTLTIRQEHWTKPQILCYAESALWDYVRIVPSSNKVSVPIEAKRHPH